MCLTTQESINGVRVNKHSCLEIIDNEPCTVVVHDNSKILYVFSAYGILETKAEIYCKPTKEEAQLVASSMGLEWPQED